MAQQTINVGAAPNDGTGTPLRTAFQYTNSNFTELYTATGPSGNNIVVPGSATITGDLTVDTSTLKVDSANNRVGIGTATPGNTLHVIGGNAGQLLLDNGNQQYTQLLFQRNSALNTGGDILIDGTASTFNFRTLAANMPFVWQLIASAGSPTTAMTLNSTGNLVLKGGTAAANGVGVTFPATQVASSDANTLDDYEEGTFTVGIAFGGASVGVVYAQQIGIYTKVGRIVHFSGRVDLSNKGSSTGEATITGLPFNASLGAASVGYQLSAAPSGAQVMLTLSGTVITVRYATGTTTAESTDANFANNSIIIFGGTYAV